jgi:hypothetical protein
MKVHFVGTFSRTLSFCKNSFRLLKTVFIVFCSKISLVFACFELYVAFFPLDGVQCFLYLARVLQDLPRSSTSRYNSDSGMLSSAPTVIAACRAPLQIL